ncbi:MFS transporter [Phytohalomonas tamaricis]|uniref:MFS transporter n=1 Tax=Phytohalomonas tamaricis TaxID=2081032 RepID=UPI0021D480CB|nr:MFS transporter [Phytohalomonas tamaricis]
MTDRNARDTRLPFLLVAFAFLIAMLGTTLPTPLYPLYQQRLGLSELMITVIFAAYAVGVIGALLTVGSWSDQLGRKRMLLAGLALSAASAAVFLTSHSLTTLLLGRVLSGLSAGIFTGTATVAVVELAPKAWQGVATLIATAVNMVGLGLGPLTAGVLAEYAPWPVRLPFAVDLALIAAAALGVWFAPETVERPDKPRLRLQRLSVPSEVRGVFIPAAIAGFAGFAVLGFFTATAPAFVGRVLNHANSALIGLVVLILFVASALGQRIQSSLGERRRMPLGCAALAAGVALIGVSIMLASLPLLMLGAVIAGLGKGVTFRAGMGAITTASPAERRAEVASTFFVVLYVAISLPVVGIGVAADLIGLRSAGMIFAALVAVLALVALGLLRRRQGKAS